jgi:hypothetical protein
MAGNSERDSAAGTTASVEDIAPPVVRSTQHHNMRVMHGRSIRGIAHFHPGLRK